MKTFRKPFVFSFLPLLALFLTFTQLNSCEEEDNPIKELNNVLVGTWQAIPTWAYKPYKDLIIEFKADHSIDLYFPFVGDAYYLTSETSLEIIHMENMSHRSYTISFNGDQTITIYNFQDGKTTQVEKNITFEKIKQ